MKVKNKVIIVTGAGSGMGREITLNLLSKGAKVMALDINRETLTHTENLARKETGELNLFVIDITERSAVEALFTEVINRYGYVDALINNAGIIQPFIKLTELNYDTIERVININFYGTLNLIKTFLPHLQERPEAHIVNTSSMGGFLPVPGQTIYGASKAAIKLLTEGLISEMAGTNVKVSVVLPGGVNTSIMTNSGLPDIMNSASAKGSSKVLSAKKAAAIIIDGMEKDRERIIVGRDAWIMDILYRISPSFAARLIAKSMRKILPKHDALNSDSKPKV